MHAQDATVSGSATGLLEAPVSGATFDRIYREAGGDAAKIPWADLRPCPALVSWLNTEAAGRLRPGARAVVVGCGLGDDVSELAGRGYDATGFDVSPAAVEWARRRFPDLESAFIAADALNPPSRFRHRFDLVVEINTLQAVDPAQREPLAAAIAGLACPRGLILTVARGRDDADLLEHVHGPPWPLSPSELLGLFESRGWRPARAIDDFHDDERPPKRRLRAVFVHG